MVGKQAMALFSELDKRSFFYHLRLHYLTTVSIFFFLIIIQLFIFILSNLQTQLLNSKTYKIFYNKQKLTFPK